jgi:hypothetical protein
MTPAAIPLPGLVTKHDQAMAATGSNTTRRHARSGDVGKLKEGAVAVPPGQALLPWWRFDEGRRGYGWEP